MEIVKLISTNDTHIIYSFSRLSQTLQVISNENSALLYHILFFQKSCVALQTIKQRIVNQFVGSFLLNERKQTPKNKTSKK